MLQCGIMSRRVLFSHQNNEWHICLLSIDSFCKQYYYGKMLICIIENYTYGSLSTGAILYMQSRKLSSKHHNTGLYA